jgi:hypothetical protein
MRFEIRPDGKKYRLVAICQEEYRGGTTNTYLRNASYAACEKKRDEMNPYVR